MMKNPTLFTEHNPRDQKGRYTTKREAILIRKEQLANYAIVTKEADRRKINSLVEANSMLLLEIEILRNQIKKQNHV